MIYNTNYASAHWIKHSTSHYSHIHTHTKQSVLCWFPGFHTLKKIVLTSEESQAWMYTKHTHTHARTRTLMHTPTIRATRKLKTQFYLTTLRTVYCTIFDVHIYLHFPAMFTLQVPAMLRYNDERTYVHVYVRTLRLRRKKMLFFFFFFYWTTPRQKRRYKSNQFCFLRPTGIIHRVTNDWLLVRVSNRKDTKWGKCRHQHKKWRTQNDDTQQFRQLMSSGSMITAHKTTDQWGKRWTYASG